MIHFLKSFDLQFLKFIQSHFQSALNDKVFLFITTLGNKGFIWIVIALVLIIGKKHRRAGMLTLIALLLATLLGEGLLKHIIQRSRPFVEYSYLKTILSVSGYSFPSGHTTSSFAAAGVLANELKKYKFFFFILAFAIAFSRLYLLLHFPTDIMIGILLGSLCALITVKVSDKIKSIEK